MKVLFFIIVFAAGTVFADTAATLNRDLNKQAVDNRTYVSPSSSINTSTKTTLPGSTSFSKNNVPLETQGSFSHYETDKNRAVKELTDYVQRNNLSNPGSMQKAEQLSWESKRAGMKMNDGEKTLEFKTGDSMAVGGMEDGENSISMGRNISSSAASDGAYDIGN